MNSEERVALVTAIHATPTMLVLAVAGGGNAVITDLLDVPGASRTVLEARVPYAATAMAALLALDDDEPWGDPTAGAVSISTARTMAEACLERAHSLSPEQSDVIGVACTAALVTDRPKKGEHRAHIAIARGDSRNAPNARPMEVVEVTVQLEKGARDRSGEDRVVADALLDMIARASGVDAGSSNAGSTNAQPFSDDADWTWVLEQRCPECGLEAGRTSAKDVAGILRSNAAEWVAVLGGEPHWLTTRPRADKWSPLEYAFHVRDVFEIFDDRLRLMLTEEGPHYPNWDQDVTAVQKDYGSADPRVVAVELAEWAERMAERLDSVAEDQWHRTGYRSDGAEFTVETFAQYFIHDPVHHIWDVRS